MQPDDWRLVAWVSVYQDGEGRFHFEGLTGFVLALQRMAARWRAAIEKSTEESKRPS